MKNIGIYLNYMFYIHITELLPIATNRGSFSTNAVVSNYRITGQRLAVLRVRMYYARRRKLLR
jgi:hypothetical protein